MPPGPDSTNDAIAVVIGRAGSRGLPGKNALPLLGEPMICHSIRDALESERIERVIVSTDGDDIAAAAEAMGVTVVRRPAELAGDAVAVDAPVRHALRGVGSEHGIVVILYANAPVRPAGLIDRAIAKLIESGADSVQSYAPVGKHHPNWMVRIDERGAVRQYAETKAFRRQDLEPLHLPDGGVIAVRRAALDAAVPREPASFFGRDRRAVINEPGAVVDIDEPFDLLIAEQKLLANRRDAQAGASTLPGNAPC